jgi:hypothetical protein
MASRPSSSKIVLAQVPRSFNGQDKAKWDTFFDALTTYIGAYDSEFDMLEFDMFNQVALLSVHTHIWVPKKIGYFFTYE